MEGRLRKEKRRPGRPSVSLSDIAISLSRLKKVGVGVSDDCREGEVDTWLILCVPDRWRRGWHYHSRWWRRITNDDGGLSQHLNQRSYFIWRVPKFFIRDVRDPSVVVWMDRSHARICGHRLVVLCKSFVVFSSCTVELRATIPSSSKEDDDALLERFGAKRFCWPIAWDFTWLSGAEGAEVDRVRCESGVLGVCRTIGILFGENKFVESVAVSKDVEWRRLRRVSVRGAAIPSSSSDDDEAYRESYRSLEELVTVIKTMIDESQGSWAFWVHSTISSRWHWMRIERTICRKTGLRRTEARGGPFPPSSDDDDDEVQRGIRA
jgi:hypothetical protein